jgi:glutaredoxin-related protein
MAASIHGRCDRFTLIAGNIEVASSSSGLKNFAFLRRSSRAFRDAFSKKKASTPEMAVPTPVPI